jgi:hypothetical protein
VHAAGSAPATTGAMQALESLQQTAAPAEAVWASQPPAPLPPQDSWAPEAEASNLVGEVIYNSTAQANEAVQTLAGSHLRDCALSVHLDASVMGGGTLTVYNLPAGCTGEELQAHFADSVPGAAPYVVLHEGSVPPPGPVVSGAA